MSEKRFVESIGHDGIKIIDSLTGKKYFCSISPEILDLMNEIGKENKEFEKQLKELEDSRQYHKEQRAELQHETELLWQVVDGVRAFIKLKDRDYERE